VLSGLKGRDVIDIGASAGDTALYFVLNGTRKVIAVEPLPNVTNCAEENVNISGLAERTKIANTILGKSGHLRIPCNYSIDASVDFLPLLQQCAGGTCEVRS
jgi:FkbM family methyltransferase